MESPNGVRVPTKSIETRYNATGRISEIFEDGVVTLAYGYDPLGRVTGEQQSSTAWSIAAQLQYAYNSAGRLAGVNVLNDGSQIVRQSYAYDLAGRVSTISQRIVWKISVDASSLDKLPNWRLGHDRLEAYPTCFPHDA